jgi:hypothetical protein
MIKRLLAATACIYVVLVLVLCIIGALLVSIQVIFLSHEASLVDSLFRALAPLFSMAAFSKAAELAVVPTFFMTFFVLRRVWQR